MHQVVAILPDKTPAVVAVLCDAFSDYPVMRYVLAGSEGDYADNLSTLIGFFVGARVWRREPVMGIEESGALAAAAIMTPPGERQSPRELLEQRERVWQQLGSEARARYEFLGEANSVLLENYHNAAKERALEQARNLYGKRDASFRGFRQI